MKALLYAALSLVLICSIIYAGNSDDEYRILLPRTYHADEVGEVENVNWYGLFDRGSTFSPSVRSCAEGV